MTKKYQYPSLGNKIKRARKNAGLSQKQLAGLLELSDKSISAYELDRAEPSLDSLRKISQATNTSFRYFFDEGINDEAIVDAKLTTIERELAAIKKILSSKVK